jgi:hypothetical protein
MRRSPRSSSPFRLFRAATARVSAARDARRRRVPARAPRPAGVSGEVADLAVGAALLVPAALSLWPYRLVQQEMGLRRSLEDWSVPWASFLASSSHADTWLLSLVPSWRINEVMGPHLFPGIAPLALAGAALLWSAGRSGGSGGSGRSGGRVGRVGGRGFLPGCSSWRRSARLRSASTSRIRARRGSRSATSRS